MPLSKAKGLSLRKKKESKHLSRNIKGKCDATMNNPLQNFKNRRSKMLHNQPSFLDRLAELMGEGYTFNEGATLLLPHHVKDYQTVLIDG